MSTNSTMLCIIGASTVSPFIGDQFVFYMSIYIIYIYIILLVRLFWHVLHANVKLAVQFKGDRYLAASYMHLCTSGAFVCFLVVAYNYYLSNIKSPQIQLKAGA